MALTYASEGERAYDLQPTMGYSLARLVGKTLVSCDARVHYSFATFKDTEGVEYQLGNTSGRDDEYVTGEVWISDITGDLDDLVGSPITLAEEVSSEPVEGEDFDQWTFYRIETAKGMVVFRFEDNDTQYDFYSAWVDFAIYPAPKR